MRFLIKLLGLAGIIGAAAVTAIAIDRKRQRLVGGGDRVVPLDRRATSVVDAEIVVDPNLP